MQAVYLVQPNYHAIFNEKVNYWLPYSIGTIWCYANQNKIIQDNFNLKDIFFKRSIINDVVEQVSNNAIFAFSNYVWNWEYNNTLAKAIKLKYPSSRIVFGGPQVNNRPLETKFFKKYSHVDSVILGEGEIAFEQLLIDIYNNKNKKIYHGIRNENLDFIPSPYTTGFFDNIVNKNPNVTWSATLETNRGCPYSCTFCDWGSLTYSKVKKFHLQKVFEDIEWMGKNNVDLLAVADANFGIFKERDFAIAEKICEIKQKYNSPNSIPLNYAKNSNRNLIDIVELFSRYGLSRGMTISFQSLDALVLESIKRKNMDINHAGEIFQLLEEKQLNYYSELILGMPEETLESWKEGLIKIISLGQHQTLDIYLTSMLENSELNQLSQREKYDLKVVTVQDTSYTTCDDESNILEKTDVIYSTSTLSNSDLIDAFMFSWIIINLHNYGWTQIYSRFLNNTNLISYRIFYNNVVDYIVNNQLGIVSEKYQEYKNKVTLYFNNNPEFIKQKYNQDLLRDVQPFFYENATLIEDTIFNFIKTQYDLEFNTLNSLKDLQTHFISSYNKVYPYNCQLDIGILDTILFNKDYERKIASVTVSICENFLDKDDFLKKVFTRRRWGWGKTKIKEQNGLS